MSEQSIRINPDVLRATAADHDDVVSHIEAARERGGDIRAAVESYGPIMHQVKDAVAEVLANRDTALGDHANRHRGAADTLRQAAVIYTNEDQSNAEHIAAVKPTI